MSVLSSVNTKISTNSTDKQSALLFVVKHTSIIIKLSKTIESDQHEYNDQTLQKGNHVSQTKVINY